MKNLISPFACSIAAFFGVFLAFALLPSSAHALNPCTGAAGEVQVGVDNGVPLCEQYGNSAPQQQQPRLQLPPMRSVTNYWAAAFHEDVSAYWVVSNQRTEAEAKAKAGQLCAADMGSPCNKVISAWNNALMIMEHADGNLEFAYDNTLNATRKVFADTCKPPLFSCAERYTLTARPGWEAIGARPVDNTSVAVPTDRNDLIPWFTVVAFSKTDAGDDRDFWFVTAQAKRVEVEQRAIAKCERESGRPCGLSWVSRKRLVAEYISDTGTQTWISGFDIPSLQKTVKARCDQAKIKCTIGRIIDPFVPRQQRVPNAMKNKPYYTSIGWIKGNKKPWSDFVWVSGGNSSAVEAERAVLEKCRVDSAQECEIVNTSFNRNNLVYRDENGNNRTSQISFDVIAQSYADQKCLKDKVKCKMVAIIDGRVSGLRVINAANGK